jgi:uncharacterized protein YkwD
MFPITVNSIALGTFILASSNLTASAISVPSLSSANTPVVQVSESSTSNIEQSIFKQINQYRTSKGLSPLSRDPRIDSQSKNHSQDMANGKIPLSHEGFDDRVKATGIVIKRATENVAYNKGFNDPAAQAIRGWLKSPAHLGSIQGKDYNQTGIGVATNSKGEIYFTQIFVRTK